MPSVSNVVETVVKLQGSREFQQQAKGVARSLGGIGTSSEQAGKKTKMGWKGIASAVGGAAAIYKAGAYVKSAVSSTEDFAKATMTLQRATGMDAKSASSWAEITKVRGINTKQFQVGLVKLSKTMELARGGNAKSLDLLQRYGVTQDQIAKGDIQGTINSVADSFALMKNPAEKAALAANLFGKSGQALVPLLQGGSQGIQDQMDLVEKYGARLGNTEGAKEMAARQREMKYASDGLKIAIGTQLLPVIESLVADLLKVVQVAQPFLRNSTLMQATILVLTAAFVAFKVASIAATISAWNFNAALLLIPLAIVALVAGFVILYNKWGWFHRAVDNTFQWVKKNWPLLLGILTGPFGLATVLIVKNFGKIRDAASGAVHAIADRFRDLINFVKGVPAGLMSALRGAGGVAGRALSFATSHLPGMAQGGTVTAGGSALVGETGPEIVSLPRAAKVTPLPAGVVGGGGGTVVTRVYLDKRQIAEAVGSYTADRVARR
jgi:hypothetical protein